MYLCIGGLAWAATMTHDYKRNGTTTLFAALEVVTGRVIGECLPRRWSALVVFYRAVSSWLRRRDVRRFS